MVQIISITAARLFVLLHRTVPLPERKNQYSEFCLHRTSLVVLQLHESGVVLNALLCVWLILLRMFWHSIVSFCVLVVYSFLSLSYSVLCDDATVWLFICQSMNIRGFSALLLWIRLRWFFPRIPFVNTCFKFSLVKSQEEIRLVIRLLEFVRRCQGVWPSGCFILHSFSYVWNSSSSPS